MSEIYSKLKNSEPYTAPVFCKRGIKPLFSDVTIKEKIRILRSSYDAYNRANQINQRGIDFGSGEVATVMEKRIISSDDFGKLQSFARSIGTTVNDCIMALFARSLCKNIGTEKAVFPSTIDLRKFISQGINYGISNYTSNCMCTISVKPDDTLADTVKQVSRQMSIHKSTKSILKSVMLWNLAAHAPWFFLKRNYPKYAVQPVVTFTNLGIIDMARLNFNRLKIQYSYLTASIKPRPYIQVTASTYNGCCTLGCNIYGTQADIEFVNRLLDDMCVEIIDTSQSPAALRIGGLLGNFG